MENLTVLFELAQQFADKGEDSSAIEVYEKARELNVADPRLLKLAELYLNKMRSYEAIEVILSLVVNFGSELELVVDAKPPDPGINEALSEARNLYERVLNFLQSVHDPCLNPDVGLALYWLGIYVQEVDGGTELATEWKLELSGQVAQAAELLDWNLNRWCTWNTTQYTDQEGLERLQFIAENSDVGAFYYIGLAKFESDLLAAQEAFESIPPDDPYYPASRVALAELMGSENLIEAITYAEEAISCAPESPIAHQIYLSILESGLYTATDAARQVAPCLVEKTRHLSAPITPGRLISEDPEEWARFNSRHIQNVVAHQAQIKEVLSEQITSQIEAVQKDVSAKLEAATAQIRREISPAAMSSEQAIASLHKELYFWDQLCSESRENLVNAERRLNYPECLQVDDFCGCVIELANMLERELKRRIYDPVQEAYTNMNPNIISFISLFTDEKGRPKFTLHAFASAIQSGILKENNLLHHQCRQISSGLGTLAKTRNRAAHTGSIGFREAKVFREGVIAILEILCGI